MKICPVGTELFHAGRTDRVTDTRKLIVLVFKLSPCCSNDKVSFSLHHLLKMEPTQCSETSAFNTQTPGELPRRQFIKLIVAFRNFAKAPKNSGLYRTYLRHIQSVNCLRVHSNQTALPNTQQRYLYKSLPLTLRLLMSYIYIYIYGAPILDVSRSHTTTQHSR